MIWIFRFAPIVDCRCVHLLCAADSHTEISAHRTDDFRLRYGRTLVRPQLAIPFLFKFNRFDQFHSVASVSLAFTHSLNRPLPHHAMHPQHAGVSLPVMTRARIGIARSTDSVGLKINKRTKAREGKKRGAAADRHQPTNNEMMS